MASLQIPGHPSPRPREVSLAEIREVLGDCHRCELGDTRNSIVFGAGNPRARVMIVGEAPGRNEDLQGEPFVGAAGKNLDRLLDVAELERDDIYIANVVKCRPPGNRNPKVGEIEACAPFLREQIRSIWPDVIVCLGNFATRFVLHTDAPISAVRGRFHRVGHFQVLPVFHPAAAIYDRTKQPVLEEDFRLLGRWLKDHPVPESPVVHGDDKGDHDIRSVTGEGE